MLLFLSPELSPPSPRSLLSEQNFQQSYKTISYGVIKATSINPPLLFASIYTRRLVVEGLLDHFLTWDPVQPKTRGV